jgi:hypothetical protein
MDFAVCAVFQFSTAFSDAEAQCQVHFVWELKLPTPKEAGLKPVLLPEASRRSEQAFRAQTSRLKASLP